MAAKRKASPHGRQEPVSFLDILSAQRAERYLGKEAVDLHAGLARGMRRLTKRFLRPLGLVSMVVDYRSARWLREICRNLPPTRRDGTPWGEDIEAFARDFASESMLEEDNHPTEWGRRFRTKR